MIQNTYRKDRETNKYIVPQKLFRSQTRPSHYLRGTLSPLPAAIAATPCGSPTG